MMNQFFTDGMTSETLLLVVAMFFLLHAVVRAFLKMGIPVEEKQPSGECEETFVPPTRPNTNHAPGLNCKKTVGGFVALHV